MRTNAAGLQRKRQKSSPGGHPVDAFVSELREVTRCVPQGRPSETSAPFSPKTPSACAKSNRESALGSTIAVSI